MEEVLGHEEIQLGLAYMKEKNLKEAAHYFRKALLYYKDQPNLSPGILLSFYGVSTALGEKNLKEGIAFCKKALMRKDKTPEMYLNLAELYIKNREKKGAYKTLEEGIRIFKKHPKLVEKLKEFGIRKKPPVPLLNRSHPVNKILGKVIREPIGKK